MSFIICPIAEHFICLTRMSKYFSAYTLVFQFEHFCLSKNARGNDMPVENNPMFECRFIEKRMHIHMEGRSVSKIEWIK